MLSLASAQVVQETALRWKKDGKKIAFVPTMGALHEGHLALVEAARKLGNKVVVSIFVNPLQFAPNEDLSAYPRTLEADREKLEALDVDLLFTPTEKEFYPEGFSTRIQAGSLAQNLCGRFRPGHFDGVATVCLKLFQITQADFAILGEKDFQQFRVLQQMTADFNLPIAVIPHTTMRASDGLALSSRNTYLTAEQREQAARIPKAWKAAREYFDSHPAATVGDIVASVAAVLEGGMRIQYLELASEKDLTPLPLDTRVAEVSSPRLFLAAHVGNTRLIDNFALDFALTRQLLDSPEKLA